MILVMDKTDFDSLNDSINEPAARPVFVNMFDNRKKARAYMRDIITEDLESHGPVTTFVMLEIGEYKSSIVSGKMGVIISSRDLK